MIKKNILKITVLASISIFLASCGSTQNVAQAPQPQAAETKTEAEDKTDTTIQNESEPAVEIEIENEVEREPDVEIEDIIENKTEAEAENNNETESDSELENNGEDKTDIENGESVSTKTEISFENENETENAPEGSEENTSENSEESTDSEKVSDEDSNFDKEREDAPTTDEKDKVSEYRIFEEPDIIVHDLPEPEKEEIKTEQPKSEEPELPAAQAVTETEAKVQEVSAPAASEEIKQEEPEQKEETSPASEEEQITPSRSVNVKTNQYLDVTYPGAGWTYIGETDKKDLFNYFGRKLGTKNTTFSLRAKKPGTTVLHFYKNDALTGEYIDDYLQVNVEEARGTGRVKAPSYADIVPAKPQRRIDRANGTFKEEIKQETEPAKKEELKQEEKSEQKELKEHKNKSPSSSKEIKKPEVSASNKKEASKASPKQKLPEPAKPSVSASPAPVAPQPDSDIKTVIQTTEEKKAAELPVPQENPIKPVQNSFDYTPTSSESIIPEESPFISSEPDVTSVDDTAIADESLLEKAKKDFADKKYADALKEAQDYYNSASTRLDEALYLLGQISESNSQVRDIRFAVDSYDMLVKRFPASKYWKQAKNRSIYLKRFYIDIR